MNKSNAARAAGLITLLLAAAWPPASAQSYPTKPVRIVTTAPGSAAEQAGRLIAPGLSAALGQQIVIENRGLIATEIVAKTAGDGYTLLLYGSPIWITPFFRDSPWDPLRDFAPVSLMVGSPNILVVHPSLPVKSVKELIALAKARPGELNYGSGSIGASPHLSAELFKSMAGVNIVRVGYKGTVPALTALLGGELQVLFPTAVVGMPPVKMGKLRAIAVTTAQPSALAPGLPTMAAAGLAGYESVSLSGILAPSQTPAAIVNRLNQEIVRLLNRSEIKERLFSIGLETYSTSPEEFAATIKLDMARWSKLITEARLRE